MVAVEIEDRLANRFSGLAPNARKSLSFAEGKDSVLVELEENQRYVADHRTKARFARCQIALTPARGERHLLEMLGQFVEFPDTQFLRFSAFVAIRAGPCRAVRDHSREAARQRQRDDDRQQQGGEATRFELP